MSNIPINWEKYELENIFEISKNKFNPKNSDEEKRCVELEHLSQQTGKLLGFINSKEQESTKNVFDKGNVLFGKLRPYLKKYWKADFDGVCSSEIWVLNGIKISNNYLFQFVQSDKFNQVANISSGSKMPRADWKYMSKIPFNIPSMREQDKIVNILSTWDIAIEKQEKLIRSKVEYKRGIIQKIFKEELKFKSNNGMKFLKWKNRKLSTILTEHKSRSTGEEKVFSVSVHKGLINQIEHMGRSYAAEDTNNYNLVKSNDVVYTKSPTGNFPYGIIKQSSINENVIVSPLYGVFTPETKYLGYMLNVFFESNINVHNYLHSIVQKGAKNTINITNSTFLSKSLKLPTNKEEQQKIAELFTLIDKEINLLRKNLTELVEQKKGLMQKLLTGEVRVKI